MKVSDIKKLVNGYHKVSAGYSFVYLDEAIYGLCNKYPDHADEKKVYGKIALVNNAYRANIQTSKKNAEWMLAHNLVQKEFDNTILPFKKITTFDVQNFSTIVNLHSQFVRITKQVLGRYCHSFCAKYLHFHFPKVVPIYDSRAYETAWRLVGTEVGYNPLFDQLRNSDYAYHCACVLKIIQILKENGVRKPHLKPIDVVLYEELY